MVTLLQTLPRYGGSFSSSDRPKSHYGSTLRTNPMPLVEHMVKDLTTNPSGLAHDMLAGANIPQFGPPTTSHTALESYHVALQIMNSQVGVSGTPQTVTVGANYQGVMPGAGSVSAKPYTVFRIQTIGKARPRICSLSAKRLFPGFDLME